MSTRSEVWLSILHSILQGTDVALLKSPGELASIADTLEEAHYTRFNDSGQKMPNTISNFRANDILHTQAIVEKHKRNPLSKNPRIDCLKELRTHFNLPLKEAKELLDKFWK